MAISPELESIQVFLNRLRQRYLFKPRLIGTGIYLIWVWLSFIVYLAWAYPPWYLMLSGLAIPAAYGVYNHIYCPGMDELVAMIDRRCEFEQRLVTVWQYRNSQEPVLPLLSKDVVKRLAAIDIKTVFPVKINPKIWLIPSCLLIINIYFWHHPLKKPLPPDFNLNPQPPSQNSTALVQVADRIEQFSEQLAKSAGNDPARRSQEAERLKEISRDVQNLNDISDPARRAQALAAIKRKLSSGILSSTSVYSAAPPVPQPMMDQIKDAEPEKRPWLEFEVKSKHLMALMEEMEKLGLNSDQIKSQFLKDLLGLLDSIIQIKSTGSKTKLVQTPVAYGAGGTQQGVQMVRRTASETEPPKYNPINGSTMNPPGSNSTMENYPPPEIGREWQGKQDVSAALNKLSPAYRNQVQAILKNQDIPKIYQQQVTDYFDAVNGRF